MSNENKENQSLETVFEKYAELQLQQSKETNKRIDQLSDKMGTLVEIVAKSEERHNSHNEKLDTLNENQRNLGKDFSKYKNNNDERVMNVEKQLLLLDQDSSSNKKKLQDKEESSKSIRDKVLGSVITAAILGMCAILWRLATAS